MKVQKFQLICPYYKYLYYHYYYQFIIYYLVLRYLQVLKLTEYIIYNNMYNVHYFVETSYFT